MGNCNPFSLADDEEFIEHTNPNMKGRYYPPPTVIPYKNPQWETSEISNDIKGETNAHVQHAQMKMMDKQDTSIDAPWWVNREWSAPDIYTAAVMVIFGAPVLLVWPMMFIFCLAPVSLNYLYMKRFLPDECDTIPRDSKKWKYNLLLQFILSLPVQFLAILWLVYTQIVIAIFGGMYLLVSSAIRRKSPMERLKHNLNVLAPFAEGPALYMHFEDCVAAVAGSVHRQGILEFIPPFVNMFLLNPWLKYWVTANIYIDDLDERFLTQIGQSLNDIAVHKIDQPFITAVSRAKLAEDDRLEMDGKMFAPHYPYPPEGRRYAIGMQHNRYIAGFVHATHFQSTEVAGEGPIASRSNSLEIPFYRVMLWRNNPYHIYTGHVEANLSTGWPSQPEKKRGLEHPMWLVNSHNKLAADRDIKLSLANIDNFFDELIPTFNHYIRLKALGRKAADAALNADPRKGYEQQKNSEYKQMAEV